MPPCDSSVRYFLVRINPPGQHTFSYSSKLNLSTALRPKRLEFTALGESDKINERHSLLRRFELCHRG